MLTWKFNFFTELSALRLYQILKLRQDVFVLEQYCLYMDIDNLDQQALHLTLISEENDQLLAYCRILPANLNNQVVVIGRVVVSKGARQQGLATQLLTKTIDFIKNEMQERVIKVSAQIQLQSFYQSLGFKITSEPYDEDGIEHISMTLINETIC